MPTSTGMSDNYRHLLLAVDFMQDQQQLIDRAVQLASQQQARLSLAHVVEYFPMDLANELVIPQDLELESQLLENARRRLADIEQQIPLSDVAMHVELGQTSHEIIRLAEEYQVDLIVVGSHGRHGISRILGSTANAILHHAPCDVLAVRIQATSDAEA